MVASDVAGQARSAIPARVEGDPFNHVVSPQNVERNSAAAADFGQHCPSDPDIPPI
jgi:hypothetical protein